MLEIRFNSPDMPVFPYVEHWRYDVILKSLPFWIMNYGQQMFVPYSEEMHKALVRWAAAKQKQTKTSKHPPYNTRLAPEFWNVYVSPDGAHTVVELEEKLGVRYKPYAPNLKQRKIADLQRMIVGFSYVKYSNSNGIASFIGDVKKVEKLTGKKFDWDYPDSRTVRVWRVL